MDRRTLLGAGAALLATPLPLGAQPGHAALSTRRMNNVMIAVSNLDRSVAFYQKLFGPAVIDGDTALIRIGDGPHFLGITQVKNGAEPGFLSYGLTVADFDPARVRKAIAGIGFKAESSNRAGTPEVWAYDPDAI